jgi:phosphoglycerate kinase
MLDLPTVDKFNFEGKNVLVRADLEYTSRESPRGKATDGIVAYLKEKGAVKIKLIGHKGIPEMVSWWNNIEINFDVRADKRELENSLEMAEELSSGWNVFVNESFAESHREYTSVNALPKLMKSKNLPVCIGLRFGEEIERLSKVFDNPKRPVVMLISGAKEDKLSYIEAFSKFADKILIGGRLPDVIQSTNYQLPATNVLVADLIADREDITIHSIEKFKEEIKNAGTIVVSGPLGKFEDDGHRQGTERIFKAVVDNKEAFKVAGGGDTEKALQILGVAEGFDWISVGGGAMLEFLAKGTLPGIEALS